MIYIVIGIFGFIAINFFDLVSIKKIAFRAKPIIWTAGFAILIYSIVRLCMLSDELNLPPWAVWAGWVIFAISLFMILMALFINLPFRKTYISTGTADTLIKTGLYALVRHPGIYWVTSFMFSLVLVSSSKLMLIAAPIFSGINILLVVLEDKYFFPKMFEGYSDYQRETPMLVPNRQSVKTFIDSLKRSRSGNLEKESKNG